MKSAEEAPATPAVPKPRTRTRKPPPPPLRMQSTVFDVECGVDEVARGCLFGRVYAGAVVWRRPNANGEPLVHPELPKGVVIRDSKSMSKLQRERAAKWIHEHALAVGVAYRDERYIDQHNIRKAAHDAMAGAIREVRSAVPDVSRALIDGDGFAPTADTAIEAPAAPMFRVPTPITPTATTHQQHTATSEPMQPRTRHRPLPLPPHACVVKGDATFFSIACAAIVAKVAHDQYVRELCSRHPELDERYALCSNVGYGSKAHRDGLLKHGASPFHRRTFGGVPDWLAK